MADVRWGPAASEALRRDRERLEATFAEWDALRQPRPPQAEQAPSAAPFPGLCAQICWEGLEEASAPSGPRGALAEPEPAPPGPGRVELFEGFDWQDGEVPAGAPEAPVAPSAALKDRAGEGRAPAPAPETPDPHPGPGGSLDALFASFD